MMTFLLRAFLAKPLASSRLRFFISCFGGAVTTAGLQTAIGDQFHDAEGNEINGGESPPGHVLSHCRPRMCLRASAGRLLRRRGGNWAVRGLYLHAGNLNLANQAQDLASLNSDLSEANSQAEIFDIERLKAKQQSATATSEMLNIGVGDFAQARKNKGLGFA